MAVVVQRSRLQPQVYSRHRVGIGQAAGLESASPSAQLATVPEPHCSLLTCAAAAYTFKRELKHERRARAFVRAAELHAQLGDNGSHAQAIARSCQQIVRAEGMHASARRLIALAKEGASSKMRRLAEWVEEQHGGDCDGGEGVLRRR